MNNRCFALPAWRKTLGLLCLSIVMAACGKENVPRATLPLSFSNPSDKHLVLHSGETYRIAFSGDAEKLLYRVQDSLVAAIDDRGVVTAGLVGESIFSVRSESGDSLAGTVTVNPRHNAYREPLYGAEVSRRMIEEYETRAFEREQPFIEGQLLLRYTGERPEIKRVVYIYDTVNDRVLQAYVEFAGSEDYTNLRCKDFLAERYTLIGIDRENIAPDGTPTPLFYRDNVLVKPRKIGAVGAVFYMDPSKK